MLSYLKEKIPECVRELFDLHEAMEIMLNPAGVLWYKHINGNYVRYGKLSREEADSFVYAVANYHNKIIDERTPYIDCTLPFNNERFHAKIPPIVDGVSFNIRKHLIRDLHIYDYLNSGILIKEHADYLKQAINERKNILISGGPGSGKTTFANMLLNEISFVVGENQHIVTLEDTKELSSKIPNHTAMNTTEYTNMQRLLWLAMRSSPDRLMVGEVRDGSALDLGKAWNTDCPGGIATIHANSATAALQRMVDLCHEAINTPPHRLIAEAVDVVVQISQDRSHPAGRRVTEIIDVIGFDRKTSEFLVLHHLGGNNA